MITDEDFEIKGLNALLASKNIQIEDLSAGVKRLEAIEENCCGMNPEGVADLEMRFEVLIGDYRTLHKALTKLSKTHANQIVHNALRDVNDCWVPIADPKIMDTDL